MDDTAGAATPSDLKVTNCSVAARRCWILINQKLVVRRSHQIRRIWTPDSSLTAAALTGREGSGPPLTKKEKGGRTELALVTVSIAFRFSSTHASDTFDIIQRHRFSLSVEGFTHLRLNKVAETSNGTSR